MLSLTHLASQVTQSIESIGYAETCKKFILGSENQHPLISIKEFTQSLSEDDNIKLWVNVLNIFFHPLFQKTPIVKTSPMYYFCTPNTFDWVMSNIHNQHESFTWFFLQVISTICLDPHHVHLLYLSAQNHSSSNPKRSHLFNLYHKLVHPMPLLEKNLGFVKVVYSAIINAAQGLKLSQWENHLPISLIYSLKPGAGLVRGIDLWISLITHCKKNSDSINSNSVLSPQFLIDMLESHGEDSLFVLSVIESLSTTSFDPSFHPENLWLDSPGRQLLDHIFNFILIPANAARTQYFHTKGIKKPELYSNFSNRMEEEGPISSSSIESSNLFSDLMDEYDIVIPSFLQFIACFVHSPISHKLFQSFDFLWLVVNHSIENHAPLCIQILGAFLSTPVGCVSFMKESPPSVVKSILSQVLQPTLYQNHPQVAAIFKALSSILSFNATRMAPYFYHHKGNEKKTLPIEHLKTLMAEIFSDLSISLKFLKHPKPFLRHSILDFYLSLSGYNFGLEMIAKTPVLIDYLLDRSIPFDKNEKEYHYAILNRIIASNPCLPTGSQSKAWIPGQLKPASFVTKIFGTEYSVKIHTFVKQGVYYMEKSAQASVEMLPAR